MHVKSLEQNRPACIMERNVVRGPQGCFGRCQVLGVAREGESSEVGL